MEKGIAFHFMPEDVRIWCLSSINYQKLLQFNGDSWDSTDDVFAGHKVDETKVFSLPENFKVEEKSEVGWVVFNIIDDSFEIENTNQKGKGKHIERFAWYDWQGFLSYCKFYGLPYVSFGGWQYEDSYWFMSPTVMYDNTSDNGNYRDGDDVKSAIPTKIRFWRVNKK